MNQPPDPIWDYFVDREPERTTFKEMAMGQRYHRIFCVKASDKGGKSWLLKRLKLESKKSGWPAAYIDLDSADAENAELVLRAIAKQMGGTIQQALDQVVLPGPGVNIQSGGGPVRVEGSVVGGHQVTVNTYGSEKYVAVEVLDRHGYQIRVDALTRAFKQALEALPAGTSALLCLDQFELVNPDYVLPWLQSEFFEPLRSGDTARPVIVIASKEKFAIFGDSEWENAVLCADIPGLSEEAIREYWLVKRKLPEDSLPGILTMMLGAGGLPGMLSDWASLFERGLKATGGGNG